MPVIFIFFILIAAIIILMLMSKGRYDEYLKALENNEYRLKFFIPMALFILEKINYKYSSKYDRNLLNKYSEIFGKKNSKFYLQIHIANGIVFTLVGIAFIFLISSVIAFQQIELDSNKTTTNIKESSIVERPSFGSGNKDIQVEAELQNGKVKAIEQFNVPVKEMPPLTDDEKAVDKIIKNLTEASIKGSNENLTNICRKLNLPANDIGLGNLGVNIVWKSEKADIIKADGTVSRPQYGTGNKKVILQAILSKGRASYKKNFNVTVIQSEIPLSDLQKVLAAKSEIQKEIEHRSSAQNNAGSLILPTKINSLGELKINWLTKGTENNNVAFTLLFGFILLVIVIILADT